MAESQLSRVLLTSEAHFSVLPSGEIYSNGPATYSFWSRYLQVFDEVVVVARVKQGHDLKDEQQRADGPHVSFRSLPDFTGPWQYLKACRQAMKIGQEAISECNAYLLRVPGLISQIIWQDISRLKKQYAAEVVGDPWQALSPGTWRHILRPLFRIVSMQQLKRICAGAVAINYVTYETLQKRYPPSASAYAAGFSDVALEMDITSNILEERYQRVSERLGTKGSRNPIVMGFIGSLSRLYKGPDVLLRAAALCASRLDFKLIVVGEGRHYLEMKALAAKLGIQDRVEFPGGLSPGRAVFKFLDSIDVFIMPSRAEGLPRALVEAMSRGCPCIASAVGGISELLSATDLVPVGNHEALAKLILQVAKDSNRLLEMSSRNLARAAQFTSAALNSSRRSFLEIVKQRSQ